MEQANIRMVLDRVLVAEEPWEFRTESGILIDHASVEPPHWSLGAVRGGYRVSVTLKGEIHASSPNRLRRRIARCAVLRV